MNRPLTRAAGVALPLAIRVARATDPRRADATPGARPPAGLLLVGGLTVAALLLRLWVALPDHLWRDETAFVAVTTLPSWGEMFAFLREHESHPPLYYVLMRVWFGVFGASDTAAAVPAVLLGTALVPAMYLAGARMVGVRTGVIAAALAAFSPVLVEHAALARPYALLQLLFLASTYLLWRALRTHGTRHALAYGASAAALVYTHSWGFMVLGAHGLAVLVALLRQPAGSRREILRQGALALGCVALLYAPWVPTLLHQAAEGGHRVPAPPPVAVALQTLDSTLWVGVRLVFASPLYSALLMGLCGAYLLLFWRGARGAAGSTVRFLCGVAAGAVILAWGFSAVSNLLLPRTLAIVAPGVLLALAAAIARLPRATVWAGALAGLYLFGAASLPPKTNAGEMAFRLAETARPEDVVLFAPVHFATSFRHYAAPPGRVLTYPPIQPGWIASYTESWEQVMDPGIYRDLVGELRAAAAEGRRVWLVSDESMDRLLSDAPPRRPLSTYQAIRRAHYRGLWQELGRLYGPPAEPFGVPPAALRYEHARVHLFRPGG